MKKIIGLTLAAALLATGVSVSAQETTRNERGPRPQHGERMQHGEREKLTPEQRAAAQTDRMKNELSLSDAQYQQVFELNFARAQKEEQEREALRIEMEARRAQMEQQREVKKAEREAQQQALRSILSEEQLAKMDEEMQERRNRPEGDRQMEGEHCGKWGHHGEIHRGPKPDMHHRHHTHGEGMNPGECCPPSHLNKAGHRSMCPPAYRGEEGQCDCHDANTPCPDDNGNTPDKKTAKKSKKK